MELQNLGSTPGILGESKTFGGNQQHKGLVVVQQHKELEMWRRQSGNLLQDRKGCAHQRLQLELQNLGSTPGILGESKTESSNQHKGLDGSQQHKGLERRQHQQGNLWQDRNMFAQQKV